MDTKYPGSVNRAKSVKLYVDPNWNKVANVVKDEDLDSYDWKGPFFSQDQVNHLIVGCLKNGMFSKEQADQLRKEVAGSTLPKDLGVMGFVECGYCKLGHGWLVAKKYESFQVWSKRDGREMVAEISPELGLTDADKEKLLSQIEASTMPEEENMQTLSAIVRYHGPKPKADS